MCPLRLVIVTHYPAHYCNQLDNIKKCHEVLKPGGVLVTYCSQGQFKRDLAACGFTVTNPEGPMGKREITVAFT